MTVPPAGPYGTNSYGPNTAGRTQAGEASLVGGPIRRPTHQQYPPGWSFYPQDQFSARARSKTPRCRPREPGDVPPPTVFPANRKSVVPKCVRGVQPIGDSISAGAAFPTSTRVVGVLPRPEPEPLPSIAGRRPRGRCRPVDDASRGCDNQLVTTMDAVPRVPKLMQCVADSPRLRRLVVHPWGPTGTSITVTGSGRLGRRRYHNRRQFTDA